MRLQTCLLLGFVAIAAIPIGVLSVWPLTRPLEFEVEQVAEKHLLVAKHVRHALKRYHRDTMSVFDMVAANPEMTKSIVGVQKLLLDLQFNHICVVNISDRAVTKVFSGSGRTNLLYYPLRRLARFLVSVVPGKTVMTPVQKGPDGKPTIYLVRRAKGSLVIGALSTDYIVSLGKAVTFGKNGHAAIVDQRGRVLAHPTPRWVTERRDISGVSAVGRMMKGETGVTKFYSPAKKADMIAGFTAVPGAGWGVMVPQPLSELEDRAHSIRNQAYGTLFAGVVLAMLLAWLITSRVTRPLSEVLAAARRLSVGKIGTRVDVPGRWTPRETRELATGFNQMATALQRSHEYLERNVERRTKQLQRSEQQLRKAKEVAESANKAKSTFLAQMSHELRTPLNAILGYSEIMAREMFGPIGSAKYREYLMHVHESGSHLRDVIGDILDASKLEDGGMVLVTENVPIRDIVDAALVHTAPAAQQRDMRIFKLLPSDSPVLHVDKTRMVQVLTNIIANAVKFTLSGGAIFVAAGVARDGSIKFKIRDTGVGIPEDDLSRISEPFQQSENGFKCTTEGAGLGVTIATTLARLHGGELVVKSSTTCGTFITVSLPATCIVSNVTVAENGAENGVGEGVNPQRSARQKLQPAVPEPTIP